MRLVLKLKPKNKVPLQYPRRYIRDFIYSCLEDTEFDYMHDNRYKHFSFSNIFPFKEGVDFFYPGNEKTLIISSPLEGIVELVGMHLAKNRSLDLGDYNLELVSMKFLDSLRSIDKVITATPVVVRIPEHLFEDYSIEVDKEYIFWDKSKFLNAFYEAILKNAIRRYNDFCKRSSRETDLSEDDLPMDWIQTFVYRKTVYGWDKHFTGSHWKFEFSKDWQQSPFTRYIYESGLGERNGSSGAGFINKIDF